mgnify:CR=1 FL=1
MRGFFLKGETVVTFRQLLRIVEIRTKVVSVSGLAIGCAYTWYRYGPDLEVSTFIFVMAVLAVDMATTGFNTFFDYFHGVDRRDHNREPDKVLVHQGVPAGTAFIVSMVLYAVAVLLGLFLAIRVSLWLVPVGAMSMLVGFLYNAGPVPISRTPLGEVFAGGFLGWVLVSLTIFVVRGGMLSATDLLVGVPSLFLVASILTVNNTCDIYGDARSGRRTISVLLGRLWGERLVYILGALAYLSAVSLVLLGLLPPPVLAGLLAAGLTNISLYVGLHRRGLNHDTKGASMGAISKTLVRFTAGFVTPVVILLIL